MTESILENQVALVTGASRGIGAAISDLLGANGATVIGTATSEKGAEAISARFTVAGIKGSGMCLDVTDAEKTEAAIKHIGDTHGAVSILVNNAGITRDNLFMRMKDSEWDEVIATNLTSVYRLCRLVIKPMVKARGGRIINISSVVGITGNAGQVNYSASKAGVLGMTKSLARELGARSITINAVAPGFIESDMTDALPDEQKEKLKSEIALGRLGTPEDIAQTCLFLASPAASYITGQTISVNGGMVMT
ncbi:3-oxoacyl-ACP reductase FabG [Granulosicoccus sp. 3-233]|uniref:3-oxoacyl-ACP reductase FabG n=1 Tax=Granulosicoccus sp. 3-233 TaxID=3417969 RepID=UPI003D341AFB